jgi:hypothetical protein
LTPSLHAARQRNPSRRSRAALLYCAILAIAASLSAGCAVHRPQQYSAFITPTPLPPDSWLVIGVLGGWEHWDSHVRTVRQLALDLRAQNLPGVHVETVENKRRALALQLIEKALDRNGDGKLDDAERASAHIVLYGQSYGAASVVLLARELDHRHIPVALTIQVDSVGHHDEFIPPNVARAVNFYQRSAFVIEGHAIHAEDSAKTTIVGNFLIKMDGRKSDVPHEGISPLERFFGGAHLRLSYDSEVWGKVKGYILDEMRAAPAASGSPQP